MGAALEAGYDLGGLAACFVAIALLLLSKRLTQAVAGVLDFSVLGVRPLHGVAVALNNTVVRALNGAIQDVEAVATRFESGLIDAFGLLIAIPILLGLGVKAALEYLWSHALKPLIRSIVEPALDTAGEAKAKAVAATGAAAGTLATAEAYARARASAALDAAESYVDHAVTGARQHASSELAAASGAIVSYVNVMVDKVRAAEDAAVASAIDLAARAKTAAEQAGAAAEATAEAALSEAQRAEHVAAAAATAAAGAASATALEAVRSVAVDVAGELHDLERQLAGLGLVGLVAAVPLLATLVQSIAVEAGLENAACRSKVKGICGTDPSEWFGLLEGAALLTGALSLAELVPVGRVAVRELAGLIRQAA